MSNATDPKNLSLSLMLLAGVLLAAPGVAAQTFELGGTGADGPLIITSDTTYPLPESGVIQATRVEVAAGATLTFTRNTRNTGVILIATEEIVVNGTIDVSGQNGGVGTPGVGGPGGTTGGTPSLWGDEMWSTDHHPQATCRNTFTQMSGAIRCQPLVGADGGRGSYYNDSTPTSGCSIGGGGGGGAGSIRLISHERISGTGAVRARGGLADPTLPQGGDCTSATRRVAAQNGGDGNVFITAPTIDWTGFTVSSARLASQAVTQIASPELEGGTNHNTLTGMTSWAPGPNVQVAITHVDGNPVPASGPLFVTTTESQVTIRVVMTGCTGSSAQIHVYRSSNESPLSFTTSSTSASISNPTASETRDIIMSGLSEGRSYWFRSAANCAL